LKWQLTFEFCPHRINPDWKTFSQSQDAMA
jgi:hypothetical protein